MTYKPSPFEAASGTVVYATKNSGDSNNRYQVDSDGVASWRPGNAAVDVSLSRGAADQLDLAAGDSFHVVSGHVRVGGTGGTGDPYIDLDDGSSVGVGAAGEVRFRSNAGAFEVSENGAAFAGVGGGVTGSGADNQVAVFNGTSSLDSSSVLTFSSNLLTVTASSAGAVVGMKIENSNTAAASNASLTIEASQSSADTIVHFIDTGGTSFSLGQDGSTDEFVVCRGLVLGTTNVITFANSNGRATIPLSLAIGTVTASNFAGDLNVGLTGAQSMVYDASNGTLTLNNASNVGMIILDADGSVIINSGQGTVQDFIVRGTDADSMFKVDVSLEHILMTNRNAVITPQYLLHIHEDTIDNDFLALTNFVSTNSDVEELKRHGRLATTDSTVTTINTVAIPTNFTVMIEAFGVARRTAGSAGTADDGATYYKSASYTKKSGTVTLLGTVQDIITPNEDQAGWDFTFLIAGNDVLIQVTGATNNNITWHSYVTVRKLSD